MGPIGEAALGLGTSVAAEGANMIFGQLKQRQQLKGQRKALQQQNDAAFDLWQRTNYSAQMGELKKAGLNPGLLYGMGGGSGGSMGNSSAMPDVSSGNISPMGIMQGAMVAAQIENIKADTDLKNTEAEKKRGVDTELGKGQIANLAANTKNTEAQTEILAIDKKIREMQEGILDSTQWYEIGKAEAEWRKLVQEVRSAAAKGDIDENTVNDKIRQEGLRTVGMMIENRAMQKGIELTDAQIEKISAEIEVMFKNAETGRIDAESNATNAKTNVNRLLNENGLGSLDASEVVNIILSLGAATQFGKGGKGAPKSNNRKGAYNKWGTMTKPGGYNLK